MLNGHLLYNRDYQLDKDLNGVNIYSLENCVIITIDENWKVAYQKQIVAMNENEEITFQSIFESGRNLNITRNTIQHYLNTVVKIPCRVSIKYV